MLKKVLGVLLIAIIISVYLLSINENQFDSTVWKTEPSIRYKMSNDIIENGRFIGKSKDEVIQLLGKPEISNLTGNEHLIYSLGKAPSFFETKNAKLVIVFENGLASKIMRHENE